MKTVEQAWDIVEGLNNDAHDESWDSWIKAEEAEYEEADEEAEDLRERASLEQAEYFRDGWYELNEEDRAIVEHWLRKDNDLREQFTTYFGEEEFANEWPEFSQK